jgi:radical S-adenosyl methionine domain-containing protein 2
MKNNFIQISSRGLPETVNIHLTRACNFGCLFCYAEFAECGSARIPHSQLRALLEAISRAAPPTTGHRRKVIFAGGEPLLYPGLVEIIKFCKHLGLVTSLVSNGSLLDEHAIEGLAGSLDICALSVDSALPRTNDLIGRRGQNCRPDSHFYRTAAERIRTAGIRLKINTVVNRLNLSESLGDTVAAMCPFRWKLFQVKKVIGQNDKSFADLAINTAEFEDFVARNRVLVPPSVAVVPETADEMTGSYAMIAPNGCFFDSASGFHRYSRSILEVGVEEAFQDVAFDAEKFMKRGGSYE